MVTGTTALAVMAASSAIAAGAGVYSVAQSVHAGKKQTRLAKEQQTVAMYEQKEQKEIEAKKRRELVDQQRESIDLSKHYKTSTQELTPKDSGLRGRLTEDVLG